jgi:hypothetical protein
MLSLYFLRLGAKQGAKFLAVVILCVIIQKQEAFMRIIEPF